MILFLYFEYETYLEIGSLSNDLNQKYLYIKFAQRLDESI